MLQIQVVWKLLWSLRSKTHMSTYTHIDKRMRYILQGHSSTFQKEYGRQKRAACPIVLIAMKKAYKPQNIFTQTSLITNYQRQDTLS